MIRSSVLLTAVAMAILVAGVAAANLALVYVSIAVSILAAVTLAVGVLLRRRELFGGETGAAPQRDQPARAAPETARPVPARLAADGRVTADRGARREDTRGEQPGDLAAARRRKAGSGAAADPGPARWPASIAAKGATGREPAPIGSTERGAGRPPRPGRVAGSGRPAEPGRDRAGAGRGQGPATARPDREQAAPGRGRGEPDRAAAARADRARTPAGHDRDQETPARRDRELAGRGEAAGWQQAEAFRLPPQSERARARAEELGRAIPGDPAGDDVRDRVSEEFVDIGSQDPVRPAWPATAGPRAMGTGSAAQRAPGETGDEPEEAGPAGPRQSEPVPWERQTIPPPPVPPDEEHDRGEQPAASSAWSAWSSTRAGDQGGTGAGAGEAGRDSADRDAAHDERAAVQASAGAAVGTAAGAAGETGDREAEGATGDAAVDETADRAGPGGAAPGEAERPGADGPGETAGSTAEAESGAEPDSTHDAADTSNAAGARDAGDAGENGAAGGPGSSSPLDDQVTVVPGVPRYHRRGCILIRFLSDGDLETSTRRAAEAAGLVPCKACQPDKPASVG